MPVVGEFHRKFWRARANPILPAGTKTGWMYPGVQSAVVMGLIWGVPLQLLRPIRRQLRWYWALARWLWWFRNPAQQGQLETWIGRIEALTSEQDAVIERVVGTLQGPFWGDARQRVRACATSPAFHRPEAWVEYSRALKANGGQAQNVFRHIRVVHELRAAHDISNPEAHLVTELAYQGLASQGRAGLDT